jgi:hypothetical protein
MEVSKPAAQRAVEPSPTVRNARAEEAKTQLKAAAEEALTRQRQQEQPKPVVNTQGQTTGRLLNVTA